MEERIIKEDLTRDIIIERMLPDFASMCANTGDANAIMLTSAAFGDSPSEIEMLGLAVKYACARGLTVQIIPQDVQRDNSNKENKSS